MLSTMILAGIDIGTNTVLLLVAEVLRGKGLVPLAEEQRTPRLGRNMERDGRIRPEVFGTLAKILREYKAIAISRGASRISCCATSAVRNAANRKELLEHIKAEVGLEVEIIDGLTEGELTYRGVTGGAPMTGTGPVVLDIGGGSTEFCYPGREESDGENTLRRHSVETGSVRLTERFFGRTPPSAEQVARSRESLGEDLRSLPVSELAGRTLLGVAGTVTTLACIDLRLTDFDANAVEGHVMSRENISDIAGMLLGMTPPEVRSLSGATAGREDVLAAGALILDEAVRRCGFPELTVSTRGLRHGIVQRDRERLANGD